MPQIIPIKDLRDTTAISEMCHATNQPIYVTKNGYDDLVIMSSKAFDEKMYQLDMYEKLLLAEQQLQSGATLLDGKTSLEKLKASLHEEL